MTRILAHVHIYYPEMWPEIKSCLKNIDPVPYDLHVTAVKFTPDLERDVQEFKQDAVLRVVENKGYDVGPFIDVLNRVDLDAYDYVIKLHTKRDMPHGSLLRCYSMSGKRWRDYLLAFIRTPENFQKCLAAFQSDATLGVCAHHCLILEKEYGDFGAVEKSAQLLDKMGLPRKNFAYVAGTMFMMRARLLKPLMAVGLTLDDFAIPVRDEKASLAHSLERLCGWMVGAQGYTIKDVFTPPGSQSSEIFLTPLRYLFQFLYRSKVTRKGKRIVKICKIPVYIKG